jgi:hypothetical protein
MIRVLAFARARTFVAACAAFAGALAVLGGDARADDASPAPASSSPLAPPPAVPMPGQVAPPPAPSVPPPELAAAASSSSSEQERAIDEATSPLPRKKQISIKPSYTFPNGNDPYKAEIQFESILPYDGVFIPDLDVAGFWSIARIQLSMLSQESGTTTSAGIGDLSFVDLASHAIGPVNVGLGFASVFPMATDPSLGQSKWQLGPAIGIRLPGDVLTIAALVQNLYSVAGDNQAASLAYVTVQPFIALHLPDDLFLSSNATMNFYWRGGKSTVPVNLGLGRAFSEHFVGTVDVWYTLADDDKGAIEVRAVMDFEL